METAVLTFQMRKYGPRQRGSMTDRDPESTVVEPALTAQPD